MITSDREARTGGLPCCASCVGTTALDGWPIGQRRRLVLTDNPTKLTFTIPGRTRSS
jgi:hypothetical protein